VIILALDTTTRDGSIAVLHDGVVRVEHTGDPSLTHGQRLPRELARALGDAHVRLEDVDVLAVAAGPGSFTGLRVGIATIQGIAMAHGKRVVPVSVLEALARSAINPDRPIGAWMEAQRQEVFAALYSADGRDVLLAPVSAPPATVLASWSQTVDLRHITFVGDGATHHQDILRRDIGDGVAIVAPPPLAGIIAQIAAENPARAVLPHAIVPIYVRRSDAELARERRSARP
jgi:tRNA threonylcarbamoyladenosine biosynthesis protein TsaB